MEVHDKYGRLKVNVKLVLRVGDEFVYLKYPSGNMDLPGGHVEFGEKITDALRREVREELNYHLQTEPQLIGAWEHVDAEKESHTVYLGFLLELSEKPDLRYDEFDDGTVFGWLQKDHMDQQWYSQEFAEIARKGMIS